jgi:hypothetical protein
MPRTQRMLPSATPERAWVVVLITA